MIKGTAMQIEKLAYLSTVSLSFLFVNKTSWFSNLKTTTALNAKISEFVICAKEIIYLLLYNFHECTFKAIIKFNHKKMQLYNYQDIIYQYIVYARKKIQDSRLDSPYD